MKITHVGIGSKFEIDGEQYELVKVMLNNGGCQLLGSDDKYKLPQPFYPDGAPTVEQIIKMIKKYILCDNHIFKEASMEQLGNEIRNALNNATDNGLSRQEIAAKTESILRSYGFEARVISKY